MGSRRLEDVKQDPVTPLDLHGPIVFSRSVIYPSSTRGWRYNRLDVVETGSEAYNVLKRRMLVETRSIRGFGRRLLVYKSTENFYTSSVVEKNKCHPIYRDLSSRLKLVQIIDQLKERSLLSRIFFNPSVEETSFIDGIVIEKHGIADPASYFESIPNQIDPTTHGSQSPPNRVDPTTRRVPVQSSPNRAEPRFSPTTRRGPVQPSPYYRPIDQRRYKHTIKEREALIAKHPPKRRDIDSKPTWRSTPLDEWDEFVERFQGADILAVCVLNEGHVINAILRRITSIRTIVVPNYDFLEGIDVSGMLVIQVNT